ncbi:SDR family oxidoreductase [Nostocoides vanveenii]|jgi:NAD(P)-dependent dehydrogenase (short-subunit alcohol dehydrogenase family)|uniref:SDR family oxidoreductase n=1 Tax=Nostocoides vanveenii TaxID=330835 RepID=A0ABP4XBL8_9MICO
MAADAPLRAVVTGAAGGIGAALAAKLVAEGASVVATDRDESGLAAIADRLGTYAVPADAATAYGVERVIEEATAHLGEIDAYFANAGVIGGAGLETPDEVWAQTLDVNVMAHVRAARLLMPAWVERGHGRFVVTASAAGLLSMIGAAPYSVSKHAAVAFAEWLSITYGDKGIVVQALCPQGVQTAMLDQAGELRDLLSAQGALTPEAVAELVWEAMQDDRFLILPHAQVAEFYRRRASDTDAWLRGMRRLQAGFDQLKEQNT